MHTASNVMVPMYVNVKVTCMSGSDVMVPEYVQTELMLWFLNMYVPPRAMVPEYVQTEVMLWFLYKICTMEKAYVSANMAHLHQLKP